MVVYEKVVLADKRRASVLAVTGDRQNMTDPAGARKGVVTQEKKQQALGTLSGRYQERKARSSAETESVRAYARAGTQGSGGR